MLIAAVVLVVLPLGAILLLMAFSPRFHVYEDRLRLTTILFAAWLPATIILTPYTFALQLPGLPDLSVERILMGLLLCSAIIRVYRHDVLGGQDKYLEVLMFVFSCICVSSMARFGFLEIYAAFSRPSYLFMNGYLIPFLAFMFVKYFLDAEEDLLAVFKVFFWFGCYLVVLAFLERSELKFLVFPSYIVDPEISSLHLDRARGPFLNAAFNGVALNVAFICGLLVLPTVSKKWKWIYLAMLLLYFPAIYLTRTRSVYVHFLVTLLALGTVYQTRIARWKVFPFVMLLLFLLVGANYQKLLSEDREKGGIGQMKEIYIRLGLAEKSRQLLADNPIGGIGLAQFRTTSLYTPSEVEYQHNHLIGMAVELGLPGIGVYLAIILLVFVRLIKLSSTIPDGVFLNPNFVLLVSLVLFVDLLNNVFVEPTLHMFASVNFFVFAGIADQLYNKYARFAAHR